MKSEKQKNGREKEKDDAGKRILETERLFLREMTDQDYGSLCRILQDAETMYAYEHAFSDREAADWLQNQKRRYGLYGTGLWAVVLKETGEMIGQCGLTWQPVPAAYAPSGAALEIGYLFRRDVWHHGYASEAAAGCRKFAFEVLKVPRVCSVIRENNAASRRVAERNGMKPVMTYVKHYYGMDMPHMIYETENREEKKMKNILEQIQEHKIIAILRGVPQDRIVDVAQALYDGGIRLLEITFNQKSETKLEDTRNAIMAVKARLGDRMTIGAGTVMSVEEVHAAKEAGASFALAPNTDEAVIREIVACGMEAIPGAMTPSEVADSWKWGASVVKLFPAGNLGLSFCKAVMAPINHIPMIAVGGVDIGNLGEFLNSGFVGAGIGSSLTDKRMIAEGRYDELKVLAESYVKAAETCGQ